jgi:hypothetical protein
LKLLWFARKFLKLGGKFSDWWDFGLWFLAAFFRVNFEIYGLGIPESLKIFY